MPNRLPALWRVASAGRGYSVILAILAASLFPAGAAANRISSVSQTIRWLQLDDGAYWISYTSVGFRTEPWSLRTGTSFLSWNAGTSQNASPSRSGVGSFYATLGRRILGAPPGRTGSRSAVWVRGRGKISLRDDPSVLGSGRTDWGASVLAQQGFGRALVHAEVGYLDLGEPENVTYNGLAMGALTVSYRPTWMPGYLTTGLLGSSSSQEGDPGYAELSFGGGFPISHTLSMTLLASTGLTSVSPNEGAALQLAWRP